MSISEASESLNCIASPNHAAWLALRGAWCQAWLAAGEIQRGGSTQSFHSPWKSRAWEALGQPNQAWLGSMGDGGRPWLTGEGGSIMSHGYGMGYAMHGSLLPASLLGGQMTGEKASARAEMVRP